MLVDASWCQTRAHFLQMAMASGRPSGNARNRHFICSRANGLQKIVKAMITIGTGKTLRQLIGANHSRINSRELVEIHYSSKRRVIDVLSSRSIKVTSK